MMRPIPLLFCLIFTATLYAADEKPDLKAYQGHWVGFTVEGKGERPDRGPVNLDLVITDNAIKAAQLKAGEKQDLGEGTFELTIKDGVISVDAKRTSRPGAGQVYAGIWKVDGDTLTWCTGTPRNPRPTEYETKKGQFLLILKKQAK